MPRSARFAIVATPCTFSAVDPAELPQQLLRTLVEQPRQHQPHFHDQIAAASRRASKARRARATGTAGPTACPAERAAAPRPSERRHLDARAERRLVHRDGDDHVQIVALAPEHRMRADPHGDIQVAGRTAAQPALPLPATRTPLAVGDAGRDPHRDRLGPRLLSASRARLARTRPLLARSAARAQLRENTMCPRTVRTAPVPWHNQTGPGLASRQPRARARATVSRAASPSSPAGRRERLLERKLHLLMQIGAAFAPTAAAPHARSAPPRTDRRTCRVVRSSRREVEALEPARPALAASASGCPES